ncbi:nose resistant to fluoxetine protein 6-like isoform X2 [Periplaneta americana]|uniref:nose resistant to fluoxetine protein 6-like isoform X2 n=1 Tax=Periplaneta americana TaxID=6978 RepID=UPI0037E88976
MHSNTFRSLTYILLSSLFVPCVPDGQEISSSKFYYTFIPVRSHTWWKIYVNGSTNHSDTPFIAGIHKDGGGTDGVTLNLKGTLNTSLIGIELLDNGQSNGRLASSDEEIRDDFNWKMIANISHEVLNERIAEQGEEIGQPATETLKRSDTGECAATVLQSPELNLARQIVTLVPPFVPSSSSRVTNEQCIKDSQYYLQELDSLALWALKMHDSSAKIPPGLLNGNVNQYGDIDQCLNVKTTYHGGIVKGRYCLTTMQLHLTDPERPLLKHIQQLLTSHGMIRSELNDTGHRVPRFSAIHWALCVPASCSAQDVHIALSDTVQRYTNGTGISLRVRVVPEMCQIREDKLHLPTSTLLVIALFVMLLVIAAFATAYDPGWKSGEQELSSWRKAVQAFSLRKNFLQLFALTRTAEDIESLHGVRAIFTLMLLVAHKCMALFFNPFLNRTAMAEDLGHSWTAFARGACIYTDPFIMMSGLLTSYSFYKELERTKKLNVLQEYVSRLMRLVPNLVTLLLFCTFILPWTGTGPLWNQVVRHQSVLCESYWWRNLLFIQNYFGFENMCLTNTHHLGIDTQLFLFSPLFVYLIWRWRRFGLAMLAAIAAMSVSLCYNVTYANHLSHYVLFGSIMRQMFKTANLSYTLPAHRASIYLLGIALGFGLRHCGRDFRLKKMHLTLGWSAAVFCLYHAVISPAHMADRHYVYNPADAAKFAAFAPIAICLFIAWIIFISFIGQGGLLGQFLSWRGFLVTTRLSYAVYLLQFPIFFYTVGTNRVTQIYSLLLLLNVPELMTIIVGSILLTVLVDLPFQNLRSVVLKKPK